ncbi:MAG: penicillin-binding protein activator [Bdellovibrionales bacterium]|nr:penicillin-binding protein activator [Bdellovibrionales bacterium]
MSFQEKWAITVVFLAAACASPSLLNRQSYDSEDSEYREIVALYEAGAYESVLKWAKSYEAKSPNGGRRPHILQIRGLARMSLKQPQEALSDFSEALKIAENLDPLRQQLLFQAAWAHFESGNSALANTGLSQIDFSKVDTQLQISIKILKARVYHSRGLDLDAISQLLSASRLAPLSARVLIPPLRESLHRVRDSNELKKLLNDFSDSVIADHVLFQIAMLEASAGNFSESQKVFRSIVSRFPDSPLYAESARWLQASKLQVPSDATRIGVLLPTSGRYASAGARALQAIKMGFKTSQRLKEKVNLVVEDSGESAADALKALDRLILQHKVMAVLGPITGKGLDSVAQRSQDLGVPLISLVRKDAPEGDFIFQGNLTLKFQIESLVRFAVEKRKQKRFAILYPQDRLGEVAADFFWTAAESAGAEIRAISSYSVEETDFRRSVDELTGTLYPEARERERFSLDKALAEKVKGSRKRGGVGATPLPPIVDFDAIFIPDVSKTAGQILPMFAYRDVEHVEFLGTSLWNSEEMTRVSQKQMDGKVFFVDVFSNREGTGTLARQFVDQFVALHGVQPGPIEAVSFDAAAVLASALSQVHGSNSRERLRRFLLETNDFPGITGMIQVKNSVLFRPLKVFSIRRGQIELIERL